MLRKVLSVAAAVLLSIGSAGFATAGDWDVMAVTAKGTGIFAPANLGVEGAPGAGIILGDGSGIAAYTDAAFPGGSPFGSEFRLNGQLQPPLDTNGTTDIHDGIVETIDSGRLVRGKVKWRSVVGENPISGGKRVHIMTTARGELHFFWIATFTLTADDQGSEVVGRGLFSAIGGTGDFEGARGFVYVVVKNNVPLPPPADLPPPPLAVPFDYDFRGVIAVPDDD